MSIFCENCGKQIDADSCFCKFCGAKNEQEYIDEQEFQYLVSIGVMKPTTVTRKVKKDKKEYLLFIDTETTALPGDIYPSVRDRLVKLSWAITELNGEIRIIRDCIIKPEGFSIPESSSRIHGITNEKAQKEGSIAWFALDNFFCDWHYDDVTIIGHNIEFSKKIIISECIRNDYNVSHLNYNDHAELLESTRCICTMKESVDFCKLPGGVNNNYRQPQLKDLYYKLFGEHLINSHNDMVNLKALIKCFFELVKRGIIVMPESNDYDEEILDGYYSGPY